MTLSKWGMRIAECGVRAFLLVPSFPYSIFPHSTIQPMLTLLRNLHVVELNVRAASAAYEIPGGAFPIAPSAWPMLVRETAGAGTWYATRAFQDGSIPLGSLADLVVGMARPGLPLSVWRRIARRSNIE